MEGGINKGGVQADDDMGEAGSMICSDHPFTNNTNKSINPGGICAFCLQEKLGKLVSSSFPITIFPSSSSSTPSFRSDDILSSTHTARHKNGVIVRNATSSSSCSLSLSSSSHNNSNNRKDCHHHSRRARIIPFLLLTQKKNKATKESASSMVATMFPSSDPNKNIILKRSKSTTTPGRGPRRFLDVDHKDVSLQKRGFWSFLYHTKTTKTTTVTATSTTTDSSAFSQKSKPSYNVEEKDSPSSHISAGAASSLERKVSRSRSVGCGSRSFSGDFFERISTGLGDCTLRRVESQREAKSKALSGAGEHHHHCSKERVKCGGIFGGFVMTSSSSSSSYCVSGMGAVVHGRSRSWAWAFASPIRAFSKPSSSSKDGKSNKSNTTTTPNLSAIPSLLAVSG